MSEHQDASLVEQRTHDQNKAIEAGIICLPIGATLGFSMVAKSASHEEQPSDTYAVAEQAQPLSLAEETGIAGGLAVAGAVICATITYGARRAHRTFLAPRRNEDLDNQTHG